MMQEQSRDRLEQLAESRRQAGDPLWWRLQAECRIRNADLSLFITVGDGDDDPWYPRQEALEYCNVCPVRVQCLEWALAHNECGTWGATTEYQRRQLRRTASRATCPACGGHEIVVEHGHEICMSCAISWPTLRGVDRTEATG